MAGKGTQGASSPARGLLPQQTPLTALGVLKVQGCPWYPFLEWRQRMDLRALLTTHWPLIQGGTDQLALENWRKAVETLELDGEAI